LEKVAFSRKTEALKKFLKAPFKNLQSPFNFTFKRFLRGGKWQDFQAFGGWIKEPIKELVKKR